MRFFVAGLAFCLLALVPPLRAEEPKKPDPPKKEAEGKKFEVPYRTTLPKHIAVRVKINGKGPFNLILDTGAPTVFLATGVAKKAGLEPGKDGWATMDRLEIEGGVVFTKAKARVEDLFQMQGMNSMGLAGMELHGVIGYTLLAQYRMEIDFTRDKMTWTKLDYEIPPLAKLKADKGGIDMMANLVKFLSGMLGKQMPPVVKTRGFLGFSADQTGEAVVVQGVLKDSPADKAGLRVGDRIVRFRDESVDSLRDLHNLTGKVASGDEVKLKVQRGKASEEVHLTIKAGEGF